MPKTHEIWTPEDEKAVAHGFNVSTHTPKACSVRRSLLAKRGVQVTNPRTLKKLVRQSGMAGSVANDVPLTVTTVPETPAETVVKNNPAQVNLEFGSPVDSKNTMNRTVGETVLFLHRHGFDISSIIKTTRVELGEVKFIISHPHLFC